MKERYTEQILSIDAVHIDILRSVIFAILHWDFEKIGSHSFDQDEMSELDSLRNKLRKQVHSQYEKLGVHLRQGVDLEYIFSLRQKIKIQASFNPNELQLVIRAIDVINIEFKDNIREFMIVTPGGLGWYNLKKGVTIQDIKNCQNRLQQALEKIK